jgi:CARDB.
MKKICMLLAALLLAMLPMTAFAEGEEAPSTMGTEASALSFSIDNANIYVGMDKAYKDGYTPTVAGGVAKVVLPLIASGTVLDNTITVTPGLGEPSSSPFVYRNYQKTVSLQNNTINGGVATQPSYLVVFDLTLASGRINGVYPVAIDVQATDADGAPVSKLFTCYVTITDGRNANTTETPQSQPKIIISGYSVSPSPAEAGSELTVFITLQNTSEKRSVKNMTVTVSCDSPNFLLLGGSNIIYIDKLGKGETTEIEVRYRTDLETPAGRYNISLAMEYENSDAETLSSSGSATVEVTQPLRVEMKTPEIEPEVNAGDTMPLSFQVMNLGRGTIYNVRIELSAPGLIPTGTAFIGNMEAGTSATADMNVFIGTKNMTSGYQGEDKYGYTSGTLLLIYEDSQGTEYTQQAEIYTNINEPVIVTSSDNTEEEPEKASQWWISIVVGGAVAAGLAVYLVLRRKREGKNDADF